VNGAETQREERTKRTKFRNRHSLDQLTDMNKIRIVLTILMALAVSAIDIGAETQAPTIARLCIYVPPERLAEAQEFYALNLLPVLEWRGLLLSGHRSVVGLSKQEDSANLTDSTR
jgi:hypothetical protein